MKSLQKYIASLLLLVFSWAVLPNHTIHEIFADHQDTDHSQCAGEYFSGVQVEKTHTHCEILKTNTPVYQHPSLVHVEKYVSSVIAEINCFPSAFYLSKYSYNFSVRGPPAL